jgi:hypothetical protein
VCPLEYEPAGQPDGEDRSVPVLRVAVAPNARLDALGDLTIAYACAVIAVPTPGHEVERLIERLTARTGETRIELAHAPDDMIGDGPEAGDELAADLRDLANQEDVTRYVNLFLLEALEVKASDGHLQTDESGALTVNRRRLTVHPVNDPSLRWAKSRLHNALSEKLAGHCQCFDGESFLSMEPRHACRVPSSSPSRRNPD